MYLLGCECGDEDEDDEVEDEDRDEEEEGLFWLVKPNKMYIPSKDE